MGAISPELWEDGKPVEKAIFNDWQKISNFETINENNIIERIYDFLKYYEKEFGFNFSKTIQWLLRMANNTVIEKAYNEAQIMYQRFHYDN